MLQRGDTVSPRGAKIAIRYMLGEVAHGAVMDSGTVGVTRTAYALTLRASGTGQEAPVGRVAFELTFEAVPVGSDTVSCASRP